MTYLPETGTVRKSLLVLEKTFAVSILNSGEAAPALYPRTAYDEVPV